MAVPLRNTARSRAGLKNKTRKGRVRTQMLLNKSNRTTAALVALLCFAFVGPLYAGPATPAPSEKTDPKTEPGSPKSETQISKSAEKTEPSMPEPKPPGSESPPTTADTSGKEQLRCPKAECVEIKFDAAKTPDALRALLEQGTGMILVDFEEWALEFGAKDLTDLNRYVHGVAERGGRVLLEPMYIGTRETFKIPLVHDVITTGYDIASRAYSVWKYRSTGNYHAKIIYHPVKRHVLYVYFIHRNFGDICITLRSRCDVVEYTDSETFDLALSKQLERAILEGREVRVVFTGKKPVLPEEELSVRAITSAGENVRIYKWMVASGEVRKRSMVKQRVIGAKAITTAIDLGLKAYDLVKAYIMYKPARSMRAEVQTSPTEGGNEVQLIIFTPTGLQESSSCVF